MSDEFTITDPDLDEDRRRYQAPFSSADFDAMFSEIAQETVDAQPGLLDQLRELSTPARVGLGVGSGLAAGGVVLTILGIRGDLADGGMLMASVLLGTAAMGGLSVAVSLRGMHQRPLGSAAWLIVGLALLSPLALAAVPGLWPGEPAPFMMPWQSGCFWFGSAVAVASASVVALLQRSASPPLWRVFTAAGAGGCAGFVVQQLFCPANDLWHQVTAHGFLGLLAGAFLLTMLRIRELSRP
ncbi:MAG: hypothetical protein AAFV53_10935 [Myxococcota bacterium]